MPGVLKSRTSIMQAFFRPTIITWMWIGPSVQTDRLHTPECNTIKHNSELPQVVA